MSSDHFVELFKYDSTVNQNLLEQLRDVQPADNAKKVFAHLLAAKQVWMSRLKRVESNVEIWPDLSWEACEELIDKNRKDYQNFLSGKAGNELEKKVHYHNSKGKKFETPVRDILTHVLIHSSHHRGQVARQIREAGGSPANTDYITYVRKLNE